MCYYDLFFFIQAVQNERQPRNTATIRPESAFAIPISSSDDVYSNRSDAKCVNLTTFPPIFPLHQKLVSPLFVKMNASKLTENFMSSKERLSAGMEEALKKETFYPLGYPSFFAHDGRSETPLDATKSSLYETSARILLLSIRWARNLPSYSSLALQDQVSLLEETWSELFLISCIQWSMPLDSNPLFATMDTNLPLNNVQQKKCTQILQKMFTRFKMLAVDFSEFACLKAIILFRPATRGLFRDGPRNFEPRSDDEDDAWAGTPLSKLPRHTNGRAFGHYVGFSVQQAPYTADLRWNRVSGLRPSGPKLETLPLSHRGLPSLMDPTIESEH
ncbi:Photoreceptor-specific nuclear receptor [Araneus ventricosus]|uniref:Photoreceptor-specific nuclear receptor n=1 Tax=Araneus ventricosus TaxID=182803 RepID=A0A4Y2M760_ARAVE|nr:Photoreceptor-specific nuclear receptor [Araneus ventricosus]